VGGRKDVENKEDERQTDQNQTRYIDRKNRSHIQHEHQCDRADNSWQNCAGAAKLADDAVDRDQHEDEHHFGTPYGLKDSFGWGHRDLDNVGLRRLKLLAIDRATVELTLQVTHVVRDDFDYAQLKRLVRRNRCAFADS
jgi:hypothetical protein